MQYQRPSTKKNWRDAKIGSTRESLLALCRIPNCWPLVISRYVTSNWFFVILWGVRILNLETKYVTVAKFERIDLQHPRINRFRCYHFFLLGKKRGPPRDPDHCKAYFMNLRFFFAFIIIRQCMIEAQESWTWRWISIKCWIFILLKFRRLEIVYRIVDLWVKICLNCIFQSASLKKRLGYF